MPTLETCANCGEVIGKLETPHLWNEQVVCGRCYRKMIESRGAPTPATPGDDIDFVAEALAEARAQDPREQERARMLKGSHGASRTSVPYASRNAARKYVDHLRWPRMLLLLLALGTSLACATVDVRIIAYALWAMWVVLGLASIVMKASWKSQQ